MKRMYVACASSIGCCAFAFYATGAILEPHGRWSTLPSMLAAGAIRAAVLGGVLALAIAPASILLIRSESSCDRSATLKSIAFSVAFGFLVALGFAFDHLAGPGV